MVGTKAFVVPFIQAGLRPCGESPYDGASDNTFFSFFFLLAYLDGAQWGVEGRVSEIKVMSVGARGGHRLGWWESFGGRTRNKLHTLIEWHAGRSLATNPFTRARLVVSETTKGELARSGERRTQRKKYYYWDDRGKEERHRATH